MKCAFIIINCSVHWHFIVCIVHSLSLIVLYSYISSVVQPTNDHWYFTNCAGQGRSNFLRSKSSQNSSFRSTTTTTKPTWFWRSNFKIINVILHSCHNLVSGFVHTASCRDNRKKQSQNVAIVLICAVHNSTLSTSGKFRLIKTFYTKIEISVLLSYKKILRIWYFEIFDSAWICSCAEWR